MNHLRHNLSFLLLAGGALCLCACDTTGGYGNGGTLYLEDLPQLQRQGAGGRPVDNISYWDGGAAGGLSSIKISLGEQKAYFYKGGSLVGVSQISSGREGFNTPTGRFKISQKNIDHRSNLYGDYVDGAGNVVVRDVDIKKDKRPSGTTFLGAPMPYFMRVHGGVGMHAGYLPGYAASHGCIRMPQHMAQNFFNNVRTGTPVTVTH